MWTDAKDCAVCDRALRPGARFCAHCGSTRDASGFAVTQPLDPVTQPAPSFADHWALVKQVGALFGLLLLTSFVSNLGADGTASPWRMVICQGIDIVLVCAFAWSVRARLRPFTQRPRTGLRQFGRLAGVCLLFIAAFSGYFALVEWAGVPFARTSRTFERAGWPLWSLVLMVSVLPAVFEELAFRGVIQTQLERALTEREAWFIQAALFSVLHLSPFVFPSHFAMGLCFGWLRTRTRSLYPGMVLHGVWNGWVILGELAA